MNSADSAAVTEVGKVRLKKYRNGVRLIATYLSSRPEHLFS